MKTSVSTESLESDASSVLDSEEHRRGSTTLLHVPGGVRIPTIDVDPSRQRLLRKAATYDEFVEFASKSTREAEEINEQIEDNIIQHMKRATVRRTRSHFVSSAVFNECNQLIRDGLQSIIEDDFTICFQSKSPQPWNFNAWLYSVWIIGIIVRYCILLPFRIIVFTLGIGLFLVGMVVVLILPSSIKRKAMQKLIHMWAGFWVFSIFGVVRYHGVVPSRRPNQIFVSNHSSLIDFLLLLQYMPIATVGQQHKGVVGMLQDLLEPLGNIWFDRFEVNDRSRVARRLTEHISDVTNPPLLIFPEGVCVNNEHIVMFRKGAFEIGATICPIAIKYNKLFADPYWNSRHESFLQHMFRFMTSWCVVADVYFLEPQVQKDTEDSISFASRVQRAIAKEASLRVCPWDGYLKYYSPSRKFIEKTQKMIADVLWKTYLKSTMGIPRNYSEKSLIDGDLSGSESDVEVKISPRNSRRSPLSRSPRRVEENVRDPSQGSDKKAADFSPFSPMADASVSFPTTSLYRPRVDEADSVCSDDSLSGSEGSLSSSVSVSTSVSSSLGAIGGCSADHLDMSGHTVHLIPGIRQLNRKTGNSHLQEMSVPSSGFDESKHDTSECCESPDLITTENEDAEQNLLTDVSLPPVLRRRYVGGSGKERHE